MTELSIKERRALQASFNRIQSRRTTLKDEARQRGMSPKGLRKVLEQAGIWPDGFYLARGTVEGYERPSNGALPGWPRPDVEAWLRWNRPISPGWGPSRRMSR